jgi:hypothetical protein
MSNLKIYKNRRTVRKTLTIEGDIADMLAAKVAETNLPEKTLVNDLLRKGFQVIDSLLARPRQFKLKTFKTGLRFDITPERLEELLDEV